MIITELLSTTQLRKFLKDNNISATKMSKEEVQHKSKQLIEKHMKRLKTKYNKSKQSGGKRLYQCISQNGNTNIVKSNEAKRRTSKGQLCTRTNVLPQPQQGCSYGPVIGKQCVPCAIDKNGRFPENCRACPAGDNIFYCK